METVDKMVSITQEKHGDDWVAVFVSHCQLTAIVYCDRTGHKGGANEDLNKAAWWLQMGSHHNGDCVVDPREEIEPQFRTEAEWLRNELQGT